MLYKLSVVCTLLVATLANADHLQFTHPATGSSSMASASVTDTGISPFFSTGHGFLIPTFLLDENVEITPEEAQLRRLNIRLILRRLQSSKFNKALTKKSTKAGKLGELMPTMGGIENKETTASDEVADDDSDVTLDDEEDDATDPEEAELWRGSRGRGRWGRGRWGRGRWGRGRWGRGRFGRGRYGRSGRYGRFGRWGW